ncbi:Endonuclease/exonuclease/phosphatase [Gaertneriomyces semiglobifer]|nr:Endonuclease/exonuclease/phosphatase [Gaertneriomyces semiglobifer]
MSVLMSQCALWSFKFPQHILGTSGTCRMKIVSWNVNSIRTLRQYYPWCEYKNFQSILDALDADIICFQEMKITRSSTDSEMALVPGYDAFLTYPKRRHGYAGVTTYVRSDITPVDAEEGLTGVLGKASGHKSSIGGCENLMDEFTLAELQELDSEGRVIITDHRLFILINVYCPVSDPSEEREMFRMRFYRALQMRVEALVAAGREVVVVGDINVCHQEIDHCDPKKSIRERQLTSFGDTPCRQWLHQFLVPEGPMVDVFRHLHPTAQKAFTCWNTLLNARPVNYGTRIDYTLATPTLLPWIKDSAVEAQVMGSDHCPVTLLFADVHPETGCALLDELRAPGLERVEPHRLCAKYWDEFAGKQQKIKSFFLKKSSAAAEGAEDGRPPIVEVQESVGSAVAHDTLTADPPLPSLQMKVGQSAATPKKTLLRSAPKSDAKARKASSKPAERASGQKSLSAFFGKPQAEEQQPLAAPTSIATPPTKPAIKDAIESLHDAGSPHTLPQASKPELTSSQDSAREEWRSLLRPAPIPNCYHGEPAKEWTVNKPGPNRGRMFYLCARSVGPSSENGNSERDSSEAPKRKVWGKEVGEFRCDFFQWKKGPKRGADGQLNGNITKKPRP